MKLPIFFLFLGFASVVFAQDTLKTVVIPGQVDRTEAGLRYWSLDSSAYQFRFSSLADMMNWRSPAFFKQYGSAGLALPSLRGMGSSHTQTYWNGLSINSPVLGQFDYSVLPVFWGQSIDLHMGGAGLEFGSGAIGGAINISTHPFFEKHKNGAIGAMAGSWGLWGLQASRIKSSEKGFRRSSMIIKSARNNFPYLSTDGNSQRAKADYIQTNLNWDKAYNRKKGIVQSSLWLNSYTRLIQQPITTNEAQRESLAELTLRKMLSYQHYSKKITSAYFYQLLNYRNLTSKFDDVLHIHSFRLNFENRKQLSIRSLLKTHLQTQYDRARLEQWRLSGYLSWRRFGRKIESSLSLRPEVVQNGQWAFMPSAGLIVNLSNRFALLANLSQTFRQLTINELIWGQNLKPERANSAELGVNAALGKSRLELSLYYSDVENWILWRPSVPVWRPQNVERVQSRGIEARLLSQKQTLWDKGFLSLQVIYTYTRAQSNGKQIIFTPQHQGKAFLRIETKKWNLSPDFLWVSRRFIQSDETAYLPDYFLFGLVAQANISKNLLAELRINNLNNYNYQIIPFYAMPQRNFQVSLIAHNF